MYILFVLGTISLLVIPLLRCNLKFYIVFVAAFFAFFGFLYDPIAQWDAVKTGGGVDLVRYFGELEKFRFLGDNYEGYSSQPLSRYYLMFFSNFDSNHWLPCITAFIIYFINLILIYKIGKQSNYSKSIIAIGFITFVSFNDYFGTINTIRYPLAVTLFFLVMYWDLFCCIRFSKFLYIVPILFHPGVSIFLLARIMSQGRFKYSLGFGAIFIAIFVSGFDKIFDYLISYTDSLFGTSVFAIGLQAKTLSYTNDVVYQVPLLTTVTSLFMTISLPFFSVILLHINKKWAKKNRKFITMESFLVIMSLFFLVTNISTGNMTTRIATAVSFFSGVLIMPIEYAFIQYYHKNFNYKIFNIVLFSYIAVLLAVTICFLDCTRTLIQVY